jgi:hypothetical protein
VIFNQGLGPQAGLNQSKERRNRYAQFPPFWRQFLKKSTVSDADATSRKGRPHRVGRRKRGDDDAA